MSSYPSSLLPRPAVNHILAGRKTAKALPLVRSALASPFAAQVVLCAGRPCGCRQVRAQLLRKAYRSSRERYHSRQCALPLA